MVLDGPPSSRSVLLHENGFEAVPEKAGMYDPDNERDACGVGFIVNIKGKPSHATVSDALLMLTHMEHRGATGEEENTGDGAGILLATPHEFLRDVAREEFHADLPEVGRYACGFVFFSKNELLREECRGVFSKLAKELKLTILGWRNVPTDNSMIGPSALAVEPKSEQVFVVPQDTAVSDEEFERMCYMLRKQAGNMLPKKTKSFYICSLHPRTIVYKGQLSSPQVGDYYPDLRDARFASHMALVHSRFSTNTFPSWSRAQPLRFLGHNGEVNTLRGNKNWMKAREGIIQSSTFGEHTKKLFPIIEHGGSDSTAVDNVMEFIAMDGHRTLPEAIMMMVPEAWQNDTNMPDEKRAFYEWSAMIMEPWDGPALFTFADGRYIGGVLDRNGLRPARYYITDDDRMIMASEVGVLQIPYGTVVRKGRLQPGRMLLVDTKEHTIVDDSEFKAKVTGSQPFRQWIDEEAVRLTHLTERLHTTHVKSDMASTSVMFDRRLPAFGWTVETINMLVKPMVTEGKEALGSMGNDAPLACLSHLPRPVFDYFKQLFAQVTNPPIDPFRERIVMSLRQVIGPTYNMLETDRRQCRRLVLENPVLSLRELEAVKRINQPDWRIATIDITFDRTEGPRGMIDGIDRVALKAREAVAEGATLLLLSDRKVSADRVPIPSALAAGAVHQALLKDRTRMKVGLLLESGEVNVVHHICVLIGFGLDAVCPYMVYETVARLRSEGLVGAEWDDESVAKSYQKSVDYGMRKVMAKMGISTLSSYKGAQIFEAVGLGPDVIAKCFTNCASRIKGVSLEVLGQEALARHNLAYPAEREDMKDVKLVENPGEFHWRDGGEAHMNSPSAIAAVQDAARRNNRKAYEEYVTESDKQIEKCTLRGLLDFNFDGCKEIPLDEVESAENIVKRFCTGAMSYGSISLEAHTTLAIAMNRIGGKSNTGEGGEDPNRFTPLANGDSYRSAIKQVASGRFGVSAWYLTNADELQIKMAQGAKPGEGGELPGHKVSQEIAGCRNSTPGVGLISPPPHHDIYSIEDLKQLIYDLKCANPKARISVKLVSEVGVGVVAAGVVKGMADHILISGHDGGTGASSWTGIKHAGLPWELGLSETHQTLVQNNLRGRVVVQTDGQIRHGRDVAIACLLGAEEFGFATVPLIVMGCTMMRKCHLNTCPVGIATQDPELRAKFTGQPEHVVNFFFMVAEHCRNIMAKLGFRTINEMVGRSDRLVTKATNLNFKTVGLDLTPVLTDAATLRPGVPTHNVEPQRHSLDDRKDNELIAACQPAIKDGKPVGVQMYLKNTDRSFATTLAHEVVKATGPQGLPLNTITLSLTGSAGQSLGAFLVPGITIDMCGDANDYVGKGMMGGRIIVRPNKYHESFKPEENIIAGNVCLYGATGGEAFFSGITAERFCVRNSGAVAVCEGCGDHGCEYMTGGRAVILGKTGRNFAAGMSGGIAYVLDKDGELERLVNKELVTLFAVEADSEDSAFLRETIQKHQTLTQSHVAKRVLANFDAYLPKFVKVYPDDYRRVLEAEKEKAKAVAEAAKDESCCNGNGNGNGCGAHSSEEESGQSGKENEAPVDDIEDVVLSNQDEKRRVEHWKKLDKLQGFKKYRRKTDPYRDPSRRVKDWDEINRRQKDEDLQMQGARCMDCGVPFCQSNTGCPLSNVIPQWNDLVYQDRWREALDRLLLTNNFPEFTGRVCPAPCEGSCVLGINADPVAIKSIECAIIDKGFENGWIKPNPPKVRTGKRIAIVGGGPAGLAAADQLNKAGHSVTVYERNDRIGGLLMYGIPNMKLDKKIVQRRVDLLAAEGVVFRTGVEVGKDMDVKELHASHDAVLLTVGATWPRDLPIPNRNLDGVHFAMDFLTPTTKALLDQGKDTASFPIHAKGKHVIVIGGGDTGNDCIGTSVRMGAASVTSFEILPQPPPGRANDNPWPQWPRIFRVDYGHEEVKAKFARDPRTYNIMTKEFISDGNGAVKGVKTIRVEWTQDDTGAWKMAEVPGSEEEFVADLVFLAMGFMGPESTLKEALGIETDPRSNFKTPAGRFATSVPKLYAAGDCRRGQSLIVWAISEGRQAAREIDQDLMGFSALPVAGGIIPRMAEKVPTSA